MAVTVIVVVRVIMAVTVAVVRMAAGFLGFLVHRLDSNRELVWLTAWNLCSSMVNTVWIEVMFGNERSGRNAIDLARCTRLP